MASHILQLKITLKYSKPPIWRRIQIPADSTFLDLHAAIQDSFGWEDYHLHQFIFGDRFEEPVYIGSRHADDFVEYIPEKEVSLDDWLKQEGRTCTYEYDFGDSWEHVVVLEKILPADPNMTYPRCTAGKRACPPLATCKSLRCLLTPRINTTRKFGAGWAILIPSISIQTK